jgi:hypothetical protein
MSKFVRVGLAALLISGASLVVAPQVSFGAAIRDGLSATEMETLTDARITLVKAVLQLTAEQEKFWPAVEEAIRFRAAGRQARLANAEARAGEMRDRNAIESMRNRDPVDFLRRRADALSQRSAELRRLADAWQPLFQTLSPDQRQRLGLVAVVVFRDLRDSGEDRRLASDNEEN